MYHSLCLRPGDDVTVTCVGNYGARRLKHKRVNSDTKLSVIHDWPSQKTCPTITTFYDMDREKSWIKLIKAVPGDIKGKTYGLVAFDNKSLSAGVTQFRSLLCNWVTPAESGSLLNSATTYVLTFITCWILLCFICSVSIDMCNHFVLYKFQFYPVSIMQIVRTWWHHQSCFLVAKGNPMCSHCDVTDAIVAAL